MRLLILAAGAALSLAACGNNDQADNTQNVDEALTAENITANDVTAIDAVTGDAANMAADVDINFTNDMLDPPEDNEDAAPVRKPKPSEPTSPPSPSRPPVEPPAVNVTDNTTE